jgi:hypothetical protein
MNEWMNICIAVTLWLPEEEKGGETGSVRVLQNIVLNQVPIMSVTSNQNV